MPTKAPFESIFTSREKRNLRGEIFRELELVGMDLTGADLRGARFEKVLLERCDLTGADLRGAHFILCVLREVVMTDTKLGGDNRFYGTTICDVVGLSEEHRLAILRDGGILEHVHASPR